MKSKTAETSFAFSQEALKDYLDKINDRALTAAHKRLGISQNPDGTYSVACEFLRKRDNTPWRRETISKNVPAISLSDVVSALRHYMIEEMRQISDKERIASPNGNPWDRKGAKAKEGGAAESSAPAPVLTIA